MLIRNIENTPEFMETFGPSSAEAEVNGKEDHDV